MNYKATVLLSLGGLLVFTIAAIAQEISVGEAVEQPDLVWTVETVHTETGQPMDLDPEYHWHPTSDVTFDGEDALTFNAPPIQPATVRLSTSTTGPFILRYRSLDVGNYTQLRFSIKEHPTIVGINDDSGEWQQNTFIIRTNEQLTLSWEAIIQDDATAQLWLDQIEIIRVFPPTIHNPLPPTYAVLAGKSPTLEFQGAVGMGDLRYQWYKNNALLPGETESRIVFPATTGSQETDLYKLEVTDDLASTSMTTEVIYFDLNEVLDNEDLTFTIPDLAHQNYSNLLLTGTSAPDGVDALALMNHDFVQEQLLSIKEISAQITGPTILSFAGDAGIQINGVTPGKKKTMLENGSEKTYVAINNSNTSTVRWFSYSNFGGYRGTRILDQVQLSQGPVLIKSPSDQKSVTGRSRLLDFEAIHLGEAAYQLVKGGQIVMETPTPSLDLAALETSQSGQYRLRVSSTVGGEIISDPFDIEIVDTIGDAVEQPNLEWIYEGEKIWIPQIFETYDGDDAAALLDEGEGTGTVATQIPGPALVSFWWKNGSEFRVNEDEAIFHYEGDGWQKAEVVLKADSNEIKWNAGFFDRLQIEQVDPIGEAVEQPEWVWTYTGNRMWVPQTQESFDGEDAAVLSDFGTGEGTIHTEVPGPAIVSFWWKDGDTFSNGEEVFTYRGEGWQQVKTVILGEVGRLSWNAGYLDQIQIEDLTNDPFKQWAFSHFETEDVINNFDAVMEGDRDFDNISNFLEWALNKNVDFPNQSIGYKMVEADGEKFLGILFSRPADLGSFSIVLEASTDLSNWERIDFVVSEIHNSVNDTFTVTLRDSQPVGMGGRFIRLVVSDE